MNRKPSVILTVVLLSCVTLAAQKMDPVQWSLTLEPVSAAPGSTVQGRLTAAIEPGWHLYSLLAGKGPIATKITLAENDLLEQVRTFQPKPDRKFDPNFNTEVETYDGKADFLLDLKLKQNLKAGKSDLTAQVLYQVCTDKLCLPPRRKSVTAAVTVDPDAAASASAVPVGYVEITPAAIAAAAAGLAPQQQDPPSGAASPAAAAGGAAQEALAPFMLLAFGFGLAAIFTPCVFPMIPITMSFFLNRPSGGRRESVTQAAIFCLGIVFLFSLLGVVTTAVLGPFGVVQLGSNPYVNGFITLVFIAFGLSLLGAFEITIPSSVLTRLDQASQKGGTFGTLLMGLTFSLASFACVGPFVGTLLAASVQGGGVQPLLGMISFAGGLASPFFLLAIFPSYLKRMPRSGGWLARVKVVLGFVILAAALKYFANIDQVMQWNLLTRERFLAAWVVLFSLAGIYLLGLLRMEGSKPDEPVGVTRLLFGAAFLIFAISLIPGMFGGRLGELDAYVPPPARQAGLAAAAGGSELAWMKNRYREAFEKARQEGKPVFVNFTGYACTNCHWMKANMFTRPEVAAALNGFVLLELYTDGTDEASRQNQALQEKNFSTVAIPYYAILDAGEKVIATFPGLTRDSQEFLKFLNSGAPSKSAAL